MQSIWQLEISVGPPLLHAVTWSASISASFQISRDPLVVSDKHKEKDTNPDFYRISSPQCITDDDHWIHIPKRMVAEEKHFLYIYCGGNRVREDGTLCFVFRRPGQKNLCYTKDELRDLYMLEEKEIKYTGPGRLVRTDGRWWIICNNDPLYLRGFDDPQGFYGASRMFVDSDLMEKKIIESYPVAHVENLYGNMELKELLQELIRARNAEIADQESFLQHIYDGFPDIVKTDELGRNPEKAAKLVSFLIGEYKRMADPCLGVVQSYRRKEINRLADEIETLTGIRIDRSLTIK